MKIKPLDDDHIKNLFKHDKFADARDFLRGRKSVYQNAEAQLKCPYYCYLAKCYSMLGNYTKADACFNMALNAIPHNYQAWLEMADSYMQRGQLRDAVSIFMELKEHRSLGDTFHHKRLKLLMGRFFKLAGDYKASEEHYRDVLKDGKPSLQAQNGRTFAEAMINQEALHGPAPMAGTLEYAGYLDGSSRRRGVATNLAIPFLENRIKDIGNIECKKMCYTALVAYTRNAGQIRQAIAFNEAAYDLDQNDLKTLETGLDLLVDAKDTPNLRAQFNRDIFILSEDNDIMLSLADRFCRAGILDLSKDLCDMIEAARDTTSGQRNQARHLQFILSRRTAAAANVAPE